MAPDKNIFNTDEPTSMEKLDKSNVSVVKKSSFTENEKYYGVVFLSAVTGISAFIGFGTTLAAVKKKDPKFFQEGAAGLARGATEPGVSLAMRALGWGTFYAVTGCGLLFYGIWKLSGAKNAVEFREKMGSILPTIPKNNPPQSRTEFTGLNDFLTYVSEEWGKDKSSDNK